MNDACRDAFEAFVHSPAADFRAHNEILPVSVARAIFEAGWRAAEEHEREECAKLCDYGVKWDPPPAAPGIISETCALLARAIRRRGE
jgi:hypothetical protein